MTYKHIKFGDSEVMRSFERVSVTKGLVKNEPQIEKKASNNLNFSENFSENILKLCESLRDNGLDTFASELENNFLNYKKAQTLYNTSKEKGEDLINAAHPDGSHELKDVEGDSVIETIIDKKEKMMKVINKNPTGKLSTAKEIINAIKK